ncbi:M13 family metallopeptidase [Nocardia jiangxiensis]|uniref:M13 family metallopeptidase n=1 Tax=Nocardia jiangxiensis TaxID=282685 RepID=A0ABW6RWH9_9NOCA|nr:M13-type metalloendopeptidase [Nocardia jiangxiensis]
MSGIDLSRIDTAVRPHDDLYGYVNGAWLDTCEIPADRVHSGSVSDLRDQAELDVQAIIMAAVTAPASAGEEVRRIAELYSSFMDLDAVADAGLGPIAGELADIAAITDRSELAALLGRLQRTGVGGAVEIFVSGDSHDARRNLVHLTQSGLGLPDESYYRTAAFADICTAYVEHIEAMFALFAADPALRASLPEHLDGVGKRIFELERALAAGHWDVVRRRDAESSYNLRTFDQLRGECPEFDWSRWTSALAEGVGRPGPEVHAEVVVRQPDYLTAFARLWADTPLADWQAWTSWQVIRRRAPYLTDEVAHRHFEFYGRTLTGARQIRDRWKRGVALVQELLGDAVGKIFIAEHFPPEARVKMSEMVTHLREAYRRSIADLPWMGPDTKVAATTKLAKIVAKIGYPDSWRDYSDVHIDPNDLVGNYRRGYAAAHDFALRRLERPVDRAEWLTTPQTVNAFYHRGMNAITFPAGYLRPPYFDPAADDAVNYGAIGAVIGHEIGHAFDDQGSTHDGDGTMVDWWTAEDRAEFHRRTKALIDQYAVLSPRDLPDEYTVNGEFTIGENIGDLGGLSIAMKAYRISLDGAEPPTIDGFTAGQRFFMGWARMRCAKVRPEEAIRRLTADPHAPNEFRCNAVVRNIDDFYESFDVRPGDELYLEPEERVRIW